MGWVIGLVVLGFSWWGIHTALSDNALKREWFAECMADGKKAYECNAIVNKPWMRPMRPPPTQSP